MNRKKSSLWLPVLFAVILVFHSAIPALARSGVVTKATEVWIEEGGNSFTFRIDDGTDPLYTGVCMEPRNDIIPVADTKVEMTKLSGTSILTKIAYLGSQHFDTDAEQYAVSRAAAYAAGNIQRYEYGEQNRVHRLCDEAQELSSVPGNFQAYKVEPANGGQTILAWRRIPQGCAKVKKVPSGNDHLTEACAAQYSLAGAEYSVYTSSSLSASAKVGTLTTKADGGSNTLTLDAGIYYAKETKRPKGYGWDTKVHKLTVTGGNTTAFTSFEPALFAPMDILLQKKDGGGNGDGPPLGGAEFTVKYYDTITGNVAGLTPERTWQFVSNTKGVVGFTDAYKIGGDALYKNDKGQVVGPIGTYTIQETKAPAGYIRDSKVYYAYVKDNGSSTSPEAIYHQLEIPNERKEFRVKVVKEERSATEGEAKNASLAGAVFGLYKNDVLLDRYTVGEDNTFTTDYFAIGDGTDEIYIQEMTAPQGYVLNDTKYPVALNEGEITSAHTTVNMTIGNAPQMGTLQMTKKGEVLQTVTKNEDGTYTPVYGEAFLRGAVFEITAAEDICTAGGSLKYKAGDVVDTVTTEGEEGIGISIPLYLGRYNITEIIAPENHVLSDTVYEAELAYAGQHVEITTTALSIGNKRQKADVSLLKDLETDSLFGYEEDAFAEIRFGLYAAEHIYAADGTCIPKNGLLEVIGVTKEADGALYEGHFTADLPHGAYYVMETDTAEGYRLADQMYPVVFTNEDQKTSVVDIQVNDGDAISNGIVRGRVKGTKVSTDGIKLSGAYIGLFKDGEREFTKETAMMTDTSDREGRFSFDNIPAGKYIVREITPPDGYVLSGKSYDVTITAVDEEVHIQLVNGKIPQTGDGQVMILWGLCMLGDSIGLWWTMKRKCDII